VLIFNPSKPSKKTPHVSVTVEGVTMRFWMAPHATYDAEAAGALETALAALPFDLGWRANAVRSSQSKRRNSPGPNMGYDQGGYSFLLEVDRPCTKEEFDRALETFRNDVCRVVLD
jgi:hypothetical protein